MKVRKILTAAILAVKTVLVLTACSCNSNQRDVIMFTFFQKHGYQWNAIASIVDEFNRLNSQNYDNRQIRLKHVDTNGVEKEVNAGYYGVRKLPNLFISYADEVVKYSKTLKEQLVDVTVKDLKSVIDETAIINSYWEETRYSYDQKQYTAPIGKSLDLLFINRKLLLEVFAKYNMQQQARILLKPQQQLTDYQGQNGSWKLKDNIKTLTKPEALKSDFERFELCQDEAELKKIIMTWDGYLSLMKITHHLLENLGNLGQLYEVYASSMDDLPNALYSLYGNSGTLNYGEQINDFLYRENSERRFVLNLKNKSKQIMEKFLATIQSLKDLAPRSDINVKRNKGFHLKLPTANSPSGTFSSTLFSQSKALSAVSSTSGIKFFLNEKVTSEDIWALPYPFVNLNPDQEMPKTWTGIQQGPGIAMFEKKDPIKDQIAIDFIKYLLKQDVNEKYAADSGYLPINKASYEANSLYGQKLAAAPEKSYLKILYQVWDQMQKKVIKPASPPLTQYGAVFRKTLLKSLNIFYADLWEASYLKQPLTTAQFFTILKKQTSDDGINDYILEE